MAFLALLLSLFLLGTAGSFDTSSVGVCWGRVAWQPLPASVVVDMLLKNGIRQVKLFNADPNVLPSFVGLDIQVTVMVANELLNDMALSPSNAEDWVNYNVVRYKFPGGADIRYVSVGNEPWSTYDQGVYNLVLVPAVKNIYQALQKAGLGEDVKVTVPFNADVMTDSYPPSSAVFRADIVNQMLQVCQILKQTGSPFSVNIYPFLSMYQQPGVFTPSQIFLDRKVDSKAQFTDPGTGLVYANLFDATYDAILIALRKIGYSDLQVVLGEIGWPSDGNPLATKSTAEEFNNAITAHMLSGVGTPLRPNVQIGGFLFALLDEDMKSTLPGTFERHWGIFHSDGSIKYNLDLSGKGNPNGTLIPASGIVHLPSQWCVVKPGSNSSQIVSALMYACGGDKTVDCTPTGPGGSCYFSGNVTAIASYGFNSYYQLQNQSQAACGFGGVGEIVTGDPSTRSCHFPLGVDLAATSKGSPSKHHQSVWMVIVYLALPVMLTMI